MRILVAWDDPAQVELFQLYLGVDGNEVVATSDPAIARVHLARSGRWDVVLLSTDLGGADPAFDLFCDCRRLRPELPVVCGCPQDDIYRLVRFLAAGMKGYVLRDPQGDFVFLLVAMLDGVVEAARAEREQKVAEKLREEVESVRKVQETIIPKGVIAPKRYCVAARYEPAQVRVLGGQPVIMAGGDYYDLFSIRDDRFVVLVGDASGHGMKACMSVVTMHTLVRMLSGDHALDTAAFVGAVNRSMCPQAVITSDGGFITMVYAVLHADTNELRWCSAGHPPPLLHCLDSGEVREVGDESCGGLPLGLYDGGEYGEHRFIIPPRSRVLIYTDGLTDAFPDADEEHTAFGVTGVAQAMRESAKLPLEQALAALFDTSHTFTNGSGRHDDTSAVLLERLE